MLDRAGVEAVFRQWCADKGVRWGDASVIDRPPWWPRRPEFILAYDGSGIGAVILHDGEYPEDYHDSLLDLVEQSGFNCELTGYCEMELYRRQAT